MRIFQLKLTHLENTKYIWAMGMFPINSTLIFNVCTYYINIKYYHIIFNNFVDDCGNNWSAFDFIAVSAMGG